VQSLQEAGCDSADILEKSMESGSVLVGDVADEIAADLVLISSEAVHTKQVGLRVGYLEFGRTWHGRPG
jgi:hypothetical protein